jgi:peptidoglycan hydrolase FlgJ
MNVLPLNAQTTFALDTDNVKPGDAKYREKLEQAAVQFESMFVAHMFSEMRKASETLNPDSANGGSKPGAGLLDHAYRLVADDIAQQRAFGIADAIVKQMAPKESTT